MLLLPLAGAIVILFFDKENKNLIRWFANLVAFTGFLASVPLFFWFDYDDAATMQFVQRVPWIDALAVEYAVGIDGISLLLVLLTTLLGSRRDPFVMGIDPGPRQRVLRFHADAADGYARRLRRARLLHVLCVLEVMLVPMYF